MIYLFKSLTSCLSKFMLPAFILAFLLSCSSDSLDEEFDTYAASRTKPTISKLILINAQTQMDIGTLTNDLTFSAIPVNVRADGDAASVVFELSGAESFNQRENAQPFALKGDYQGNYNKWTPTVGSYTLKVTPYSLKDGKGTPGASVTVTFKVSATTTTTTTATTTTTTSPTPIITTSGELLFHGKFSNATITNGTIEGWRAPMESLDICRDLYLSYSSQAPVSLVTNNGRTVMKGNLVTPLNGKRVQLGVVFTENKSMDVYHHSQEMWLHPDLAYMQQYSGAIGGTPWFILFETWMSRVSEWAGDPPSRINLGIKKASGAGQPLKWHLLNQYIQPSSLAYTNILPPRESNAPIPFGVWFTMDVRIQTGEGDKGRTTITITEQGKSPVVIFDIIGTTTYPGRPEITRGTINPMKFYSHDNLINFLNGAGKKVEVLYGDFKFYKN